MSEQMFELKGPPTWGDFGRILFSGYPVGETDGKIRLMRTGPFMPPITFPALECVVSAEFRRTLEESGLTGVTFREVVKHRIVTLHWEKWDPSLDLTRDQLPPSEPEDYLLRRRHSARSAKALGDLWQLCPPREEVGCDESDERAPVEADFRSPLGMPGRTGLLWSSGSIAVSARAKDRLEGHVPEWVAFSPAAD